MASKNGNANDQWRVKVGLAEMLKGGVIMDVTTAEQAILRERHVVAGAVKVVPDRRAGAGYGARDAVD